MTKDDFNTIIQELGTLEDEAERRTRLATLTNNVDDMFNEVEELKTTNEKLVSDNEKLRQANLELFTQVGTSKNKSDSDIIKESEQPQEFEDLFDEKGMIK